MAFWDNFRKAGLEEEMRPIIPSPRPEQASSVEDSIDPSLETASAGDIKIWLDRLRKENLTKRDLFDIYDKMAKTSLVSAALELLVDDVSRKDRLRGRRVWAEENTQDNENVDEAVDIINEFLKEYHMDEKVRGYAYTLAKYGEIFFKTYKTEFEEGKIIGPFADRYGTIFEMPEYMSDYLALEKFDTLVGFGVQKRTESIKEGKYNASPAGYDVVGPDEFIHMVLDRRHERKLVKLQMTTADGPITEYFKEVMPSSYLEGAREAWSVVDLIENLILYARFGHSDFFNIVQVEVGSAGRGEAAKILRSIKRTFENQDTLNIKDDTYRGTAKPIPKNSNIFVATRQGKGEVTVTPVQPAADVKDIIDLNYWQDKLCAALRIPKAFLGLADENMAGLGNMSLTQISTVYARLVQYVQDAVADGVTKMCDFYLKSIGREELCGTYVIKMNEIVSSEDKSWREDLEERVHIADTLSMFLQSVPGMQLDKVLPALLQALINLKEVSEDLADIEEYIDKDANKAPEEPPASPVNVDMPVDWEEDNV